MGTLIPIDEGDPHYTIVPADVCGYCISLDPPDYCGRPVVYRFRIRTWKRNQVAGACLEHGAVAREKDNLEWIRTA